MTLTAIKNGIKFTVDIVRRPPAAPDETGLIVCTCLADVDGRLYPVERSNGCGSWLVQVKRKIIDRKDETQGKKDMKKIQDALPAVYRDAVTWLEYQEKNAKLF